MNKKRIEFWQWLDNKWAKISQQYPLALSFLAVSIGFLLLSILSIWVLLIVPYALGFSLLSCIIERYC